MNSTTTTSCPNQWVGRYVPSRLPYTTTHVLLRYAPRDPVMENADTTNYVIDWKEKKDE